jgi:hypothetical protein
VVIFCVKITGIPETRGKKTGKCFVLLSDSWNNFFISKVSSIGLPLQVS